MSDEQLLRRIVALEREMRRPRAEQSPSSGARVFNSGAISIPNATLTTLSFDSEVFDDADYHIGSGSIFTAPAAGLYQIGACVAFAANATGFRLVRIQAGGGVVVNDARPAVTGDLTIIALSTVVRLTASGTAQVDVYQNSGGALNVSAASAFSPYFWIARIG